MAGGDVFRVLGAAFRSSLPGAHTFRWSVQAGPVRKALSVPDLSRRGFLGAAVAVTGAAVVGATASPAAPDTLSALARGHGRHGDIRDIEHVVIVMQENRSFRPLLRIAARGARLR
jgi:hypothetical protein